MSATDRVAANGQRDYDPLDEALRRLDAATSSTPTPDDGIATQMAGTLDLSGFAQPSVILTLCILASLLLLVLVMTGKVNWTALFFRSGDTQRQMANAVPMGGPMPKTFDPKDFPVVKPDGKDVPADNELVDEEDTSYATAPTWEGIIDFEMFRDPSESDGV